MQDYRKINAMATDAIIYAYGFSRWKRQLLERFLPDNSIVAVKQAQQVPDGGQLLIWGPRGAVMDAIAGRNIRIASVEDGFLRSVGLGAEFQMRPSSWVIDQRGIYYDATTESDLEHWLQTAPFPEYDLERAKRLRSQIVRYGLTKYNVGSGDLVGLRRRLSASGRHPIILVPGQVETDASLAFGAPGIRQNLALLQAVRAANPDAFVIYKPHPDVVAGLRAEGLHERQARHWCDIVVTDIAMAGVLDLIDEVHLLTSLTGFEALLRGKKVVCYGQPFYAGWGLTDDLMPIARRHRRLSVDELVAASLIYYPLYLSHASHAPIDVETAVAELQALKNQTAKPARWRDSLACIARAIHKRIKRR